MDEVVELVAAAVVTVAAAAFSHFGVEVERPEPPRASTAPAVRRSPVVMTQPRSVVMTHPRPDADCRESLHTYA